MDENREKMDVLVARLQTTLRDLERLKNPLEGDYNKDPVARQKLEETAKGLWSLWQSRKSFFSAELVEDPGWSILLSLKVAELSGAKYSVSTVCADSGVPATTALRWINKMIDIGLLQKQADHLDKRRWHVRLSGQASEKMDDFLRHVTIFKAKRESISEIQ